MSTPKQTAAFLLAATQSGAGKTTLTLGLLAAWRRQGLTVQPFKCGPDFIDPTLHQWASGRLSRNLDLRMCGERHVRDCFQAQAAGVDVALVEGVMGLFDGGVASPAALAKSLALPVVLLVDATGCAESVAAVVKGFAALDPELTLMGVIFNRVASARHLELLSNAVRCHCQTPILGSLPRDQSFRIADRHLGLVMGAEGPLSDEQLDLLAATVAEHIDLAALLAGAAVLPPAPAPPLPRSEVGGPPVRIGLARDQAFCFYYQDNLDLLVSLGAELVDFSPLHDPALPPGLDGLYLGGGYPELHAQTLSANQSMLAALREWSAAGRPLYAECGGFITLCQGLVDQGGAYWPLAGVFPVQARMRQRLAGLGYREAAIVSPCLFGDSGTLYGHEFHYSEIEPMPREISRVYRLPDGRQEGYQIANTLAGYLHLHFGQTPAAARYFIESCRGEGQRDDAGRRTALPIPATLPPNAVDVRPLHCQMPSPRRRPEPRVLEQTGFRLTPCRNDEVIACGPGGTLPGITIIKPGDIEAASFAIIRQEFEGRTGRRPEDFSPAQFAIIQRVIHATGDFSFASNLRFHPQAIATAIRCLRAGRPVVTDVRMAAAGINKKALAAWGGAVSCEIADPALAANAVAHGLTRAETAILAALEHEPGIIAIGNAPTALLAVLKRCAEAPGRFQGVIIGAPVGFVNAAESKDLLAAEDIPHIVSLGRKGGSPVAAAMVNALIRLAEAAD